MGFKAQASNKAGGNDYELVPQGTWPGVLVGLLDIGTHEESFAGKAKQTHKVVLIWQVFPDDHEPMTIVRDYTLSLGKEANLRSLVEGWRGAALEENQEFDLVAFLGKSCNVQVIHEASKANPDRKYGRVKVVQKLMKGQTAPTPTIKPILWSVDDGKPFPELPFDCYVYGEAVSEKVKRAAELRGGNGKPAQPQTAAAPAHDEAPF